MEKKPLIILAGPTATGKTSLSIQLAKMLDAEIISADSMQVYKGMDIGTAKVCSEEMQGIKHHLIDILSPNETFHVAAFKERSKLALNNIHKNGKLPVVVGGTGFYIQALLYDIDFHEESENKEYRKALENLAVKKGNLCLHDMLKEIDEKAAAEIHPNNRKRIIRALEYFQENNAPISLHNEEQRKKASPYQFAYFVLNDDRNQIYAHINERVDNMIEKGLVSEVEGLLKQGYQKELVSMQGLGYKEIIDYLDGNVTLADAIYMIKRDTRHFAKRQLTWFQREKDVIWVNQNELKDSNDILPFITNHLKERGIIRNDTK